MIKDERIFEIVEIEKGYDERVFDRAKGGTKGEALATPSFGAMRKSKSGPALGITVRTKHSKPHADHSKHVVWSGTGDELRELVTKEEWAHPPSHLDSKKIATVPAMLAPGESFAEVAPAKTAWLKYAAWGAAAAAAAGGAYYLFQGVT